MRWKHRRKGIIEGELVREDQDTVTIKLTKPVRGLSMDWDVGAQLMVNKRFLEPLPERAGGK